MEKYDIVERVAPYLHAVGRVVSRNGGPVDSDEPTPPPVPPRRTTSASNSVNMTRSNSVFSAMHQSTCFHTPPVESLQGAHAESGAYTAQSALGSAALTSALGSCVLVCRSSRQHAVILTTSFAIATRREAAEADAIFFETKTLGTGLKNVPTQPVRVRLRPDRLFFTSAPDAVTRMPTHQRRLHGTSVGYTVVACDVSGTGNNIDSVGNTTLAIRPLTLPLLRSKIPAIEPDDLHLVVSHVDGVTRRCHGFTVEETFEGHSTYSTSDMAATFATGGAVFDRQGEFIGLHHEFGDDNYVVHVKAIVTHLYQALVLGRIGLPVIVRNAEGHNREPQEHDGSVTGIETLGIVDPRPFGDGAVVQDMQLLEYQTRSRAQRARETLAMRDHVEVFDELYDPEDFESLVLMLHAFHAHTALLAKIFEAMLSHKHRGDLPGLARLGGIGILLEALASCRHYDVPLMTLGLTLIGRVSLYEENSEALSRYSGVQTILSVAQEYINTAEVVQWGVYTLLNLVQPDCSRSKENVQAMVTFSGLRTVLKAMAKFPRERHLARWGSLCVGHVVEDNKTNFDLAVEAGVCPIMHEALESLAVDDEFVAFGVLFCVAKLTQHDSFFAATDYFVRAGIMAPLGRLLERLSGADEPQVLVRAATAIEYIIAAYPSAVGEAVSLDFESRLSNVALAHMTESALHALVIRLLRLMGVDDPVAQYPHLQLPAS